MKTPLRKRSAFVAWLASVPLALAIPAMVWLAAAVIDSGSLRVSNSLPIIVIATAVHLVGYVVTGLPLFLIKFRKCHSHLWCLPIALAVGGLLGAGMVVCIFSKVDLPAIASMCAIGAGYGVATAIAAWLQRPALQTS